jgi:hypothetical protein
MKKIILTLTIITCVFFSCKKDNPEKIEDRQNINIEAEGDAFSYTIRLLKGDESSVLYSGNTYKNTSYDGKTSYGGEKLGFTSQSTPSILKSFIQLKIYAYMYNNILTPVEVKLKYKGKIIFQQTGTSISENVYIEN